MTCPPIQSVVISREDIQKRILELAARINQEYKGEEVILISILKGSVVFLVDLMKELNLDVEIAFLFLSSYQGETAPQTKVQQYTLPLPSLEGKHVLLMEDILDTGASLRHAWEVCSQENPCSLKTCVLLVKEGSEEMDSPPIDFFGFRIPRVFVVGYGLDYQERYRQLPFIAIPAGIDA